MSREPSIPKPGQPIVEQGRTSPYWYRWFRELLRVTQREFKIGDVQTAAFNAEWDTINRVSTSSGNVIATAPDATLRQGARFAVAHTTTGNTLTVDGNGSQTIDGAASVTVTTYREFTSDGSNLLTTAKV